MEATGALADLRAAISEIVQADASFSADRETYHRASQRAINALEGTHGAQFAAEAGTPGDVRGAIGHVDALLDRAGKPVWADALHGAEANMRAAVTHLRDAGGARELMDYQIAASRALTYLEVAQGRPSQTGVFGGLEGALANTVLGVPASAKQADACAPAASAPAYGVHDGYISWIGVPATAGDYKLAENPGGTEISVGNGVVVLHTAAAAIVATSCATATASVQARPKEASSPSSAEDTKAAPQTEASNASTSLPALYTEAQAKAGEQIFNPNA